MPSRISRNDSIMSSTSYMDETVMTDIWEYVDQDKVAIYQVVDDLIKTVEVQEMIKQSEIWTITSKFKTPDRRKRLGIDHYLRASRSIPVNQSITSSLNSPFEHFNENDELPHLSVLEQYQIINERMMSVFAPFNNASLLQNIEDTFIENIHVYWK